MRQGTCISLTLAAWLAFAGAALADRTPTGTGDSGLPALAHVGVAETGPAGLAIAATAGYGFTEELPGLDGASHRVSGRLALALRPMELLSFAIRFDGRYDAHSLPGGASDDGFVGDPWILGRFVLPIDAARIGVELGLWLPGEEAPSIAFDAASLDAKLLAAYDFSDAFLAALSVGVRLDQSEKSVPKGAILSAGDAASLGVSASNAVLVGLGASYRTAPWELFGDLSAQLLVGSRAPSLAASPMRIALGARYGLSRDFALEARAEVSPSSRDGGASAGSFPLEPRASAFLGLRYGLSFSAPEARAIEESAVTTAGVLRGIVLGGGGAPVRGAALVLTVGGARHEAMTDDAGRYRFADIAEGDGSLAVSAHGYADAAVAVTVVGGKVEEREVTLEAATPGGQLRGTVRAFDGSPVRATLTITPGDRKVAADAEGAFAIDVTPGTYTVSVTAEGFEPQTRVVEVDENGVTVFNAELRSTKRR